MKLEKIRKKIDKIDEKIIRLLDSRFKLSRTIGAVKKRSRSQIVDRKREELVKKRINKLSRNKAEVLNIYKIILKESKHVQKHI